MTDSIGTRDIPLRLARAISLKVNKSWASGDFISRVSPVTRDLLSFWFGEAYSETRPSNFHEGQRQAILNTIYLHEILGIKSVKEIYENIEFELLSDIDMIEFGKAKYDIPKYAVKMATGTGKTWVMHALLIWQYLNAKQETSRSGRYTTNFLLIAPGLIVYERLLDAYLGKEDASGNRNFLTSDIHQFRDVFLPEAYREDVFGFIQASVAKKQEIGRKVTGTGLIAIANWHLFMTEEGMMDFSEPALEDPSNVVKAVFPVRPGTSGGNSLETLDAQYLSGQELEYLANLENLMVINDEAQWVEGGRTQEDEEKQWQRALNKISSGKGSEFIQIDFSATPYRVHGTGQRRTRHYFLHTIVDFDLNTAIQKGLVKTIALDKRKELVDLPLDFNAVREGNEVIDLSDGQKLMLRAGLTRLGLLEEQFVNATKDKEGLSSKHPKMLVMCEDTNVTPLVEKFLVGEGLSSIDVMRIDSNRKGEVPEEEWQDIKQRLFSIDKHETPKVIISVLMLREGFDVNNICVLVPLRSASSQILLEQTIGRGLRLMWREPEFSEIKAENRKRLLIEKKEPLNYFDLLTIVEHPAFIAFYEDLVREGLPLVEVERDPNGKSGVLGDIIRVGLKKEYESFDLFWPAIIRDSEEELINEEIDISKLEPFKLYPLDGLKKFFAQPGERFVAEEMTVKTRFGEYSVDAALFRSQSYNEYLQKIVGVLINRVARVTPRRTRVFPALQINNVGVVAAIDSYIRSRLFEQNFDPFTDDNWKVLLLKNGVVTDHIVKEIGKVVFELQHSVTSTQAQVEKTYFSEVSELRMRENYSLPISKTIYERLPYPSNKGELEKELISYADQDSKVEALMKINEIYHSFASVAYIRTDGLLSSYSPDFMIKTASKIYILETKSDKDLHDQNVRQKQLATLNWVKRINSLPAEDRDNREWSYVLLGENHFYRLKENSASIEEICELARVNETALTGRIF